MTDWSQIVSGEDLINAAKLRAKKVKVVNNEKKEKSFADIFEDDVWLTFYKMGFKHLNATNDFKFIFPGNSKQIDVVAIDDETCVFVECKASTVFEKSCTFKKELESINGYYSSICQLVTEQFGPRKFKYVFATKNYLVGSADEERMKAFGIFYADQDAVDYYRELVDHLGTAARFQLLGSLFSGMEIDGLENRVPAIKGEMSGKTYYSFLIEPDRLLKLAYVLHRNKANHLLMPTYQRLIKKDRLRHIREFVNNGGFFPNSLIVSINSHEQGLIFEPASNGCIGLAGMGMLNLPKLYRSVYVIDGQHRLYGYSESDKAEQSVVPVIAFVDLPSEDQVRMFMEINENQKKVSKSLRNTLNIDLLWNSPNRKQSNEALMLKIAEALGEIHSSPLYGRVLTGEDTATTMRCITTEYIKDALKNSSFINEYASSDIRRQGTFDKGQNDATYDFLLPFLTKCLDVFANYCDDEWKLGADGYLTINNTMYALIKVIDDIVNIQLKKDGETLVTDTNIMFDKINPMLLELCDAINEMPTETRLLIKKEKGGSAKKNSWRKLQLALHAKDPNFINDNLVQYIEDNCTDNNPESQEYLSDIEDKIKTHFYTCMSATPDWQHKLLPDSLASDLVAKTSQENFKREGSALPKVDLWHFVSFDEIASICRYASNWSAFAKELLQNISSSASTQGNAIMILKTLSGLKQKVKNGKPITRVEFEELKQIHTTYCHE